MEIPSLVLGNNQKMYARELSQLTFDTIEDCVYSLEPTCPFPTWPSALFVFFALFKNQPLPVGRFCTVEREVTRTDYNWIYCRSKSGLDVGNITDNFAVSNGICANYPGGRSPPPPCKQQQQARCTPDWSSLGARGFRKPSVIGDSIVQ
jgi:hypothetical protein